MTEVACIGECMIELRPTSDHGLARGYGGDTLNTAVYLARLGIDVDYVTALGDDPMSDEMVAGWAAEGVGTSSVLRLPGKLPGLYMIQTDAAGERKFYHWREASAARRLMDLPRTDALLQSLVHYELVYLSAITLSLYDEAGRQRLLSALAEIRQNGVLIAFDTNFRARGWSDLDVARNVYQAMFEVSDMVLASTEDMAALYRGESDDALMARIPADEVILKLTKPACLVRFGGDVIRVEAQPLASPVVDTTAAGDSFAAAYIAARLGGAEPVEAAKAGHALAGVVVGFPGAIVPREAMPADVMPAHTAKDIRA